MSVNISVQFFASYADSLGRSRMEVMLPEGSTVLDLARCIAAMPGAGFLPPNPLIAINQMYAGPASLLTSGDEVAVIPPVAGG